MYFFEKERLVSIRGKYAALEQSVHKATCELDPTLCCEWVFLMIENDYISIINVNLS